MLVAIALGAASPLVAFRTDRTLVDVGRRLNRSRHSAETDGPDA